MPDFTFKNAFFRIFWKILAKTGPQTLYSCGFPEASVEMKVAPFRALTQYSYSILNVYQKVEMKVAPFRALTLFNSVFEIYLSNGGNEGRPFQGIDTLFLH